jgi:hypothetical protein
VDDEQTNLGLAVAVYQGLIKSIRRACREGKGGREDRRSPCMSVSPQIFDASTMAMKLKGNKRLRVMEGGS